MKENTKYNEFIFKAVQNIDEIQPWFDFSTAKPWDDSEIPWLLDNKVRRQIIISLADHPKSFEALCESIQFEPKPLLISKEEYTSKVSYKWSKDTIKNHLLNLEWYKLIKLKDNKYKLTFPILTSKKREEFENYIIKFVNSWISVIRETKDEIKEKFNNYDKNISLYSILIDKAVNKLYEILKKENLLPNIPNIKALWAEQLRNLNFQDWLDKNF